MTILAYYLSAIQLGLCNVTKESMKNNEKEKKVFII